MGSAALAAQVGPNRPKSGLTHRVALAGPNPLQLAVILLLLILLGLRLAMQKVVGSNPISRFFWTLPLS
jgi:hypothetical protein